MLRQYLKSLADKFREKFEMTEFEKLNAQDFPDLIDEVYEYGKQAGGGGSSDSGKEVWKGITNNGKNTVYTNRFQYWNLDYFYPCFDLQPTNAGYMFAQTTNDNPIDLVARLEQCGVSLNFSNCTSMARTFYIADIYRIGVVDCTSATGLDYTFNSAFIKTIEKLKVDKDNTFSNTFGNALEEIRFEGEIGNNINLSSCTKLSHDSMINNEGTGVINVLATLESGVTRTLSLGTNLAKLSDAEKAVATQKGWTIADGNY